MAGFVIPWMLSRRILRWRFAPPFPRPLPPLPPVVSYAYARPDMVVSVTVASATAAPFVWHVTLAPGSEAARFAKALMSSLRPIVLCGPSGVGKSTLIRRLFDEYPNRFGFSVSRT